MSELDTKEKAELLNARTRDIYHQQHLRQGKDDRTRTRLMGITTEEFFQVPKGFFAHKKILDVGCGSIARNAISFYQMGSKNVTAIDLGDAWFSTARENMERYGIPPEAIQFSSGNVTDLPFEPDSFDFVCCDGVLPHLMDQTQVEAAIKELARVTKSTGHLFISYLGGGGLIETKIHDAAREYYQENPEFATLIDNIKPSILHELVDFSLEKIKQHNNETFNDTFIKTLLDEDLCIAIQNLLQPPRREHHRQEYINGLLKKSGFHSHKILKRYIKRKNFRKFLAPFHFYSENKLAKLLYGDGWIDCIVEKN